MQQENPFPKKGGEKSPVTVRSEEGELLGLGLCGQDGQGGVDGLHAHPAAPRLVDARHGDGGGAQGRQARADALHAEGGTGLLMLELLVQLQEREGLD